MTRPQLSFLYVEDDLASRSIISVLLCRVMGYQNVTILPDSEDFLKKVDSLASVPDIFLLDIHIAPTNGRDLLKMIRAETKYDQSKVVALTASVTTSEVNELKGSGFDGLIGKPVKQGVFPTLIDRIVAGESVWMVP